MTTTLYLATLPNCPRCRMVKRWLTTHNITHTTIDLTNHPDTLAQLKTRGATSAPVLYTPGTSGPVIVSTGFNPTELTQLTR
ncbi:hypothetical protein H8R18_00680 [Nanchangia anserum]|uniref:Glutaredoxin domain-containing protein n=1 Tax=Nanchangia anserum TaxID=2692125 RepID=A0A8I0G9R3_9ACTO|nr:glutaredoxin domain-containing protein [Nanchangia anserum]MBD3689759.1 hypothetical protein [Nanchangia anserum]QOX81930.1 hypothetical protein H8R18_00680 [Nanchangia anserum]